MTKKRKQYKEKWWKENVKKVSLYNHQQKEARRQWRIKNFIKWNQLLIERGLNKCQECGSINKIHLHHVDPTQKRWSIAILKDRPIKDIYLEELNKCIPLCIKHHRELHKKMNHVGARS